ncbi:hypothetical protein Tco_0655288 [Tanacetum coccineum]|uniref:Uncharacterized protein n=1 Tax=Tanacetum coccineum TaxID=301880 RepID=A0ABQ4X5Q0_9ASTR
MGFLLWLEREGYSSKNLVETIVTSLPPDVIDRVANEAVICLKLLERKPNNFVFDGSNGSYDITLLQLLLDKKKIKLDKFHKERDDNLETVSPLGKDVNHEAAMALYLENYYQQQRNSVLSRMNANGHVSSLVGDHQEEVSGEILQLSCPNCAKRLQLNIQKSKLYGIGVTDVNVQELARCTGCGADSLPFVYLGLPVGERMYRENSWRHLVNKFQTRLAKWKSKLMSIGGRLTLAKSVIGSLGICYLSLFPLLAHVNKQLESIRARFFGGIDDNAKKIHSVKWDLILNSKEKGGLDVGSLWAFN